MNSRYPVRPLSEFAERIDYGLTASAANEPVGPKFLRITDIVPEQLVWSAVPYCAASDEERRRFGLLVGDIVIARTGATVGYSKRIGRDVDAVFASYLVRVRVNRECDAAYVGYVVGSEDYKDFVRANAGGAAQPNANAKVLTSYPVPFPSLATQRKIAAILSAYDDLIENNTRRIKILEEMAQRIYREWFVDFRYPGHEGVLLVDSELGPIPEGWRVEALSYVVECVRDGVACGPETLDAPYVPIDCITSKSLCLSGWQPGSNAKSSLIKFGRGDVLFGAMRPYFHKVAIAPFAGITRTTCFVLRPKDQRLWAYATMALFSEPTVDYATRHSSGSTIPYARWSGAMEVMPLLLPHSRIADAFHSVVSPLLQLLTDAGTRQAILRATRDLLLPRLISGEVDVTTMDVAMPEAAA